MGLDKPVIAERILKFLAGAGRLLVLAAAFPLAAVANTDPMSGLLVVPGTAGLGVMIRSERSPYEGAGVRVDEQATVSARASPHAARRDPPCQRAARERVMEPG